MYKHDNCQTPYSRLYDAVQYLTIGVEIIQQIDSEDFNPIIAHILRDLIPLAIRLEPKAKQLWVHLDRYYLED